PRAWIAHEAKKIRTGQILPQFVDGSIDPRRPVLTYPEIPSLEAATGAESVEIVHRGNDEIRLRVNASSRGMVILSETWDPGWTVTVDGNAAQVYRGAFLFRAVVVDAGEHEVVLRYPATKVKQTLPFYLIPLIAFGLLGIVALRAHRILQRNLSASPSAESDRSEWEWPMPDAGDQVALSR